MIGKLNYILFLIVALVGVSTLCTGCTPVQPWEKEFLAKSHMAFEPDPLEARSKQHTYFSKEASSGGYGIGGGGCGCN